MAYHTLFEKWCLKHLRATFQQHAERLADIMGRLWDQEKVFKWHYIDPAFKGSTSLKGVLPVLAPDCSYDNLAVGDETQAQIAYETMRHSDSRGARND